MDILIGALIFLAGFITCYFSVKNPVKKETPTVVKRVKTSLRNPLRTYDVYYEDYKDKQSHLFQPVRPKRGASKNEVRTDDV
jgi:hypothetical protein